MCVEEMSIFGWNSECMRKFNSRRTWAAYIVSGVPPLLRAQLASFALYGSFSMCDGHRTIHKWNIIICVRLCAPSFISRTSFDERASNARGRRNPVIVRAVFRFIYYYFLFGKFESTVYVSLQFRLFHISLKANMKMNVHIVAHSIRTRSISKFMRLHSCASKVFHYFAFLCQRIHIDSAQFCLYQWWTVAGSDVIFISSMAAAAAVHTSHVQRARKTFTGTANEYVREGKIQPNVTPLNQ